MNERFRDYLYHYTSAHGLLGIVKNRRVWATQIEYLNDAREGVLITDTLRDMAQRPDVYFGTGADLTFSAKYRAALEVHLGASQASYVASFSREANMLTQHRMYCPPSGGFVIGFPREFLKRAGSLLEVTYGDREQVEWCREFFSLYLAALAQQDAPHLAADELAYKVDCSANWRDVRIKASPMFKSAEFSHEAEERLVVFGPPTQFRPSRSNSLVIPYVEIELPNDETAVVVVAGPSRYQTSLARKNETQMRWVADSAGTKWHFHQLATTASGFREI